eukprot:1657429-Amphidinium_carterae.1
MKPLSSRKGGQAPRKAPVAFFCPGDQPVFGRGGWSQGPSQFRRLHDHGIPVWHLHFGTLPVLAPKHDGVTVVWMELEWTIRFWGGGDHPGFGT